MINIIDFAPKAAEKVEVMPKKRGKTRRMTVELDEGEGADDFMYSEVSDSENENRRQKAEEAKKVTDPIEEAKQIQIEHVKGEINDIIQARTNSSPNHSSKRAGSSASEVILSQKISKRPSPSKMKEPDTPKSRNSGPIGKAPTLSPAKEPEIPRRASMSKKVTIKE